MYIIELLNEVDWTISIWMKERFLDYILGTFIFENIWNKYVSYILYTASEINKIMF